MLAGWHVWTMSGAADGRGTSGGFRLEGTRHMYIGGGVLLLIIIIILLIILL